MRFVNAVTDVAPNPAGGRDFVAGDIHGCFATLEAALEEIRYEPERDRLFSLGDLIDYGPRSTDALEWMTSRFACVVRGNHEDMMLDWTILGVRLNNPGGRWRLHWAADWLPRSLDERRRRAWRTALEALPYAATVHLPQGGRVGLIHAPGGLHPREDTSWDQVCAELQCQWVEHARWAATWTRATVRRPTADHADLPPGLADVEYALHGHDPGLVPGWTARRVLCIDTGVHMPDLGHLTIAELRPGVPLLHRFARVDVLPEAPVGETLSSIDG